MTRNLFTQIILTIFHKISVTRNLEGRQKAARIRSENRKDTHAQAHTQKHINAEHTHTHTLAAYLCKARKRDLHA